MMTPTSRNPAARYRLPQDVLDDARLTLAEKMKLLTEWALDLTERSTATDEGMAAAPIDRVEKDVSLQDRIAAALATLADQAGDAAKLTE